jgi:modulator of FtsH protease
LRTLCLKTWLKLLGQMTHSSIWETSCLVGNETVQKSQKDFSFMGGFMMVGMIGLLGVIELGFFMDLSAFQMAISAGIVLLMGAMILYQTSAIIHGGETNYVMATVTLFVTIFNLFTSLLHLLGFMGGEN